MLRELRQRRVACFKPHMGVHRRDGEEGVREGSVRVQAGGLGQAPGPRADQSNQSSEPWGWFLVLWQWEPLNVFQCVRRAVSGRVLWQF